MKKISYILTVLTGAGTVLLAGCNRTAVPGSLQGDEKFLNFSVTVEGAASVEEGNATKAEKKTSISTFNVTAWNNDGSDHGIFIIGYREFSLTDGAVTTDIRWIKPYNKVFYAYANTPANGAIITSADYLGQTLDYTVPDYAEEQTDILLGAYSGDGGDSRTAAITFKHVLTAVEFYISDAAPISSVSKITLDGVYGSGSVTQSADGQLSEWIASSPKTVIQSISDEAIFSDEPVGVPFILIPQTEAGGINVSMVVTLTSGINKLIFGTIPPFNWERGKVNKYYIGISGENIFTMGYEIADWGDVEGGNVYVN